MKFLAFLETIKEDDTGGTFVGARLTRDSERQLMHWMRENGLRKREPRARLHVTVIGDPNRQFDWNPATFEPPLETDAASYKLERFGGDDKFVVLSFSCTELEKRHLMGRKKHGISWEFDHYQPHITLSEDPNKLNDLERLLLPRFPLFIQNEYVQPWKFDDDNPETDRRRDNREIK